MTGDQMASTAADTNCLRANPGETVPSFRRWSMVAGLLIAMVTIHGIIQAGLPALDSALLADLGISRGDLKAREAIFFLASGTSSFLVGLLSRRVAPNFIVFGGLVLLALMLWLYSHAGSIGQIYGIYPFLGLCFASVHVVVVVLLIQRNFATRRAFAISVALSGTSLGAAIFPSLVVHLLKTETWRDTLTQLAVLPLIVLPFLLLLLPRNGYSGTRTLASTSGQAVPVAEGTIRRTRLRLGCLMMATFGTFYAATSFLMNLFLYLQDVGMKAETAALGMSAVFVIGLLGKAIVGLCAERWGSQTVWLVQQVILLGGAMLLTTGVVAILLPGLVLLGLGWAGCYVMTQVVLSEYFAGPRVGPLIGAFFLFEGASSALGTWAAARLFDVFGSYQVGFVINVLTVTLAIGATLVFRRSIARDR
jgi:MFS family permease